MHKMCEKIAHLGKVEFLLKNQSKGYRTAA